MRLFMSNSSPTRSPRSLLRKIVYDVTPPLALKLAQRARLFLRLRERALVAEWEILPGGFEQARRDDKIKGWDQQTILDVYARDLSALRERTARGVPFGLSETSDLSDFNAIFNHNLAACWGWVLGCAASEKREISILDWGGALGHYYLWARALRPDLTLDYTVKETPLIVEKGATLMPDVRFCGDEALDQTYDLVVAATSLHYEEEWRDLLKRLLASAREFAYLTRIPIVETGESFVVVQRPYAYGYETEYQSWCFSREDFVGAVEACGWRIEHEVVTGERIEIKGTRQIADYRGFLVRPAH